MMTLRLRARLLISYIVLLAVTLAVVTAALVLFLFAQPVSPAPTYERLATIARDVIQQSGLTGDSALPLGALRQLLTDLSRIAQENEIRILIVNMAERTVGFDSAGTFTRGDSITIDPEAYALPLYLRRSLGIRSEPIFGSLRDKDESVWIFTGASAVRQGVETNALLLADVRPPQTLESVLQLFGRNLALPLCQSALVGLLIAAVLAVFISSGLARSLNRLEQAAAVVAKGEQADSISVNGPPEVRAVADAFNHMSAEVHSARQSQQDFVANISHDLKTPLTSIQGYSQAIIDGAAKDPASAAKIIHEEAGRLNRMVAQLTDLARLQAGQLSMQTVPIDMGKLATAVGERLAILAQDKGITLHLQADPMPPIMGDGDRLAQVMTNLLSNAVKYTPSGGQIWLRTQINNGGVEVIVRDTGIGVSAADLPRIFERFYQVDKARGPRRGTGLGLAITQEIVAAHGGRITVTSAGLHQGTTFTLWLPSSQLNAVARG